MSVNYLRTASQFSTSANAFGASGGNLTFELWVRFTGNPGAGNNFTFAYIAEQTNDVEYYMYYTGNATPSSSTFQWVRTGSSDQQVQMTADQGTGWNHFALTYDTVTLRGFKNGVEIGNIAASGNSVTNRPDELSLGRFGRDGIEGDYLNGDIDEVRVWTVARTAAQIAADMWRRIPSQDGLTGHFRMDEGKGATGLNLLGTGTNLTHTSGQLWVDSAPISYSA